MLWTVSVAANTLWTGGLVVKTRETISAGCEHGAAHGFLDMEGLEHCDAPMSIRGNKLFIMLWIIRGQYAEGFCWNSLSNHSIEAV